MRIKILAILFTGVLFTSCGTSLKTNLTNNFQREKLNNEEVFIVYNESKLPKESKKIGDIKIGDSGFSTKCSKEEVLNDAKNAAKANNSNIILIDELKEPSFGSSCYRLKARIFYNNSSSMDELWGKSNNTFDENADYALIHFICKGENPSGWTYMKAGLVGGKYTLSYNDENFKISEYSVITKKIKKEGLLKINATSFTRNGDVEIDFKNGREYFVSLTTHTNIGTRVVLEKISTIEGRQLKQDIEKISAEIQEYELRKEKNK
ncbi:hypothetical protein [Flavobacterium sp.]|uniref:hypothetical protein n=1 Tax=Flavobacterium sp. TaxID=239 RepID=UPI0028BD9B88|nr:hypothetical protein [Flavobacterium sp.]